MKRFFAAALGAVFALAFAGVAMAGNPIPNIIVKGGKNPGGNANKVVIEMGGEARAYDPARGSIAPTMPDPRWRRARTPIPFPASASW